MKDIDWRDSEEKNGEAFDYGEENEEADGREEREEAEPGEKRGGLKLLTRLQIFSCIAVLAAALILRMLGGEIYQKVRTWYLTAVSDSIIAEEQMDQARRTVVGLWNGISAAGMKTPEENAASGGGSSESSASGTAAS